MAVSRDDHQRFLAIVKDIPDGCGDNVAKANTLAPRFKLRIFVNVHKSNKLQQYKKKLDFKSININHYHELYNQLLKINGF